MGDAAPTGPGIDRLRTEPEARLEYLLAHDVLREHDDGGITATPEFEDARDVYVDSYKGSSDRAFQRTVAELFDLTVEEAAERVADLELSRWEVSTYLALQGYLDADLPRDVLLELAAMTAETGGASPVPPELIELFDDSFEAFLADHDHAVVFAFQHGCDPCEAMKTDLETVHADAPADVTFAGIDGETAPEFRREFDVTVAPTTLVFADSEPVERHEGYWPPEDLLAALEDAFVTADR